MKKSLAEQKFVLYGVKRNRNTYCRDPTIVFQMDEPIQILCKVQVIELFVASCGLCKVQVVQEAVANR